MTDKAKAFEHDLREGSKPRCSKCGSKCIGLYSSNVHKCYVECGNSECDFELAVESIVDMAQFFPIAAILEENQRLAKDLQDARYKSTWSHGCYVCGKQATGKERHCRLFCDEHMQFVDALKQKAVAAEMKMGKVKELVNRGRVRYSRDRGEPDPTPPFAYEAAFNMNDWKELLAALAE